MVYFASIFPFSVLFSFAVFFAIVVSAIVFYGIIFPVYPVYVSSAVVIEMMYFLKIYIGV
jgi:hypothetical protein